MSQDKRQLVLIDAHALVHRSFHAIPPLTHRGQPLNAVYGFASTLLHVIETLNPFYLAVAFDEPGPTFRHEDFAAYKAHRPEAPEALKTQFPIVREVVAAFDLPGFSVPGYEADDVIGTLARQAENRQVETLIVTGDHDAYQLVSRKIKVFNVSRGARVAELIDSGKVREHYGFGPESVVDYKALRGDASDNIPGVPGVGEKTAKQLIHAFGSIEKLYASLQCDLESVEIPQVSAKLREKLCKFADSAFISKKLATIRIDVPIELDLSACRVKHYAEDRAKKMFAELGFRSLITRLPKSQSATKQETLF
ncbi:hypothetical protein HYW32_02370 [Candidatus Berkelbacteria bacterium]|nr:hypothetical protein [Candidatus Berkelbacteria bacterium]